MSSAPCGLVVWEGQTTRPIDPGRVQLRLTVFILDSFISRPFEHLMPEGGVVCNVTTRWSSVFLAPAGLLLCQDLPLHIDGDGRGSGRALGLSLRYQQMLSSLIHEVGVLQLLRHALHSPERVKGVSAQVNIEPCEWHHALHLPKAWYNFMNGAFHAVLQVGSPGPPSSTDS